MLVLGVAFSAWTKFAQLFALTLIPESLDSNHTIIPELYVQIGDVVLLDLEKLVEEDAETNTTALDAAFGLIPTEGCTSTQVADTSIVTANDEINCALTAAVAALAALAVQRAGGPEPASKAILAAATTGIAAAKVAASSGIAALSDAVKKLKK